MQLLRPNTVQATAILNLASTNLNTSLLLKNVHMDILKDLPIATREVMFTKKNQFIRKTFISPTNLATSQSTDQVIDLYTSLAIGQNMNQLTNQCIDQAISPFTSQAIDQFIVCTV